MALINRDVPVPQKFKFGSKGEEYILGSEANRFLSKPAGGLYIQYPSLFRRKAKLPELAQLYSSGITNNYNATLVRAKEIEQIIEGVDEHLSAPPGVIAVMVGDKLMIQPKPYSDPDFKESTLTGTVKTLVTAQDFQRSSQFKPQQLPQMQNPLAKYFSVLPEPDEELQEHEKRTDLVPISLDLEYEGYKIRDQFLWNLHENQITAEQYADILCQDLEVPLSFSPTIATSIKEQIDEFNIYHGMLSAEHFQGEVRCTINLQLYIGKTQYTDQFEWDILNVNNSPEQFASSVCADLALGGEYASVIAHGIREQLYLKRKSFVDHHSLDRLQPVDFPPIRFEEPKKNSSKPLWEPTLDIATEEDIEHYQNQKNREARYMRRSRRKTGVERRTRPVYSPVPFANPKPKKKELPRRPQPNQYTKKEKTSCKFCKSKKTKCGVLNPGIVPHIQCHSYPAYAVAHGIPL